MKYLNIERIVLGILIVVTCFGVSACAEDDELYSSELKVYVNSTTYSVNLLQTTSGGTVTKMDEIKFPVFSTRELLADAEVTFDIDTALVGSYNEKNGTNYQVAPNDLLSFDSKVITIKKGSMESVDSIKIEIAGMEQLTALEGYLIPIRILFVSSEDKGVISSINRNVVYITINNTYEYVNEIENEVEGVPLDKKNWTISRSGFLGPNYTAEYAIDGNNKTSWTSPKVFIQSPPWLSIDMGRVETLKGFRFIPNDASRVNISVGSGRWWEVHYIPKKVEVSISPDGKTWTSIGSKAITKVTLESFLVNPDFKYINLDVPVKVRYFRLTSVENYTTYTSVAEIDAYK